MFCWPTLVRHLISAVIAVASPVGSAQMANPTAGVSRELASQRARLVSGLQYDLTLAIPAALADSLKGSVVLRFDLGDNSAPLVIDFETGEDRVELVEVNGLPTKFTQVNGHIVIAAVALAVGANSVRIEFKASDAAMTASTSGSSCSIAKMVITTCTSRRT